MFGVELWSLFYIRGKMYLKLVKNIFPISSGESHCYMVLWCLGDLRPALSSVVCVLIFKRHTETTLNKTESHNREIQSLYSSQLHSVSGSRHQLPHGITWGALVNFRLKPSPQDSISPVSSFLLSGVLQTTWWCWSKTDSDFKGVGGAWDPHL